MGTNQVSCLIPLEQHNPQANCHLCKLGSRIQPYNELFLKMAVKDYVGDISTKCDGDWLPSGVVRREVCLHLGVRVKSVNDLRSPKCGAWHKCDADLGDNGQCRPSIECQTCDNYDPDGYV